MSRDVRLTEWEVEWVEGSISDSPLSLMTVSDLELVRVFAEKIHGFKPSKSKKLVAKIDKAIAHVKKQEAGS